MKYFTEKTPNVEPLKTNREMAIDIVRETGAENEMGFQKEAYKEYIGEDCTECGVKITKKNNNGDGLCTSCMNDILNDWC